MCGWDQRAFAYHLHGLDSGMRNAVNFVFIDDDDEEEDRFWDAEMMIASHPNPIASMSMSSAM